MCLVKFAHEIGPYILIRQFSTLLFNSSDQSFNILVNMRSSPKGWYLMLLLLSRVTKKRSFVIVVEAVLLYVLANILRKVQLQRHDKRTSIQPHTNITIQ